MVFHGREFFKLICSSICIFGAVLMVSYWFYKFGIEDRDIGVVDYISFEEANDIPRPNLAICHRDPRDAQALSDRERMVLTLLCDGMTNKEIAEELCIAETTARGHVQSIMRKLNVKDRTAAAVEGIRRHWVD